MSDVIDFTRRRRNRRSGDQPAESKRSAFGEDRRQRRLHLVDLIKQRMKEQPTADQVVLAPLNLESRLKH